MMTETLRPYDHLTWIDDIEVWREQRFDVRYPATGEVVGSAPRLHHDLIAEVLNQAAAKRFDLSRHERATMLNRFADGLAAELIALRDAHEAIVNAAA